MGSNSDLFNVSDPDVLLITSTGEELGAHRVVLKCASAFFRGLFSIPQPPSVDKSGSSTPEPAKIEVTEDAVTLSALLRLLYPVVPRQRFHTVEALRPVLIAAHKYDLQAAVEDLCQQLMSPELLTYPNSLSIYIIAEQLELDAVRKAIMPFARCYDLLLMKNLPMEFSRLPASVVLPLLAEQRRWRNHLTDVIRLTRQTTGIRTRCNLSYCLRMLDSSTVDNVENHLQTLLKTSECVYPYDFTSAAILLAAPGPQCPDCINILQQPLGYFHHLKSNIARIPNVPPRSSVVEKKQNSWLGIQLVPSLLLLLAIIWFLWE